MQVSAAPRPINWSMEVAVQTLQALASSRQRGGEDPTKLGQEGGAFTH